MNLHLGMIKTWLVLWGGLGFTIDAKIIVNDSYQYKVHNSHWQVFYITASDTYVNVFNEKPITGGLFSCCM